MNKNPFNVHKYARKFSMMFLVACLGLHGRLSYAGTPANTQPSGPAVTKTLPSTTAASRSGVEVKAKQQQEKAQATIDQEAIAAVEETRKVLTLIANSDKKEALAALERATGKVNILLARNPKTALIPLQTETETANTAPEDAKEIKALIGLARDAIDSNHLADARVLLDALRSEIRVRTLNLPLATYPAALSRAAQLVDQGKNDEAASVLRNALNTLVIVDATTSLPMQEVSLMLHLANEAVQKQDEKGKAGAISDLAAAKLALKQAEALGQVDASTEKKFQNQIDDIDRKIKGKNATASAFTELGDAIEAFFMKHTGTESRGQAGK